MKINISAQLFQIPSRKKQSYGVETQKRPNFGPLTYKCYLDLGDTDFLCMTHQLAIVYISAKLFQNPSRNDKVMEQSVFKLKISIKGQ
jgi:hypothetical protein